MKSGILLICVALVSLIFVACPMPKAGVGPTKDVGGGTDETSALADGASISVVNDTERNLAVYINETGQRFDVVAPTYPGGPLISCVLMVDFTIVPPSTDPDALPVKALVAGIRDDGSPGVWEVQADDSILLPQPEVTDPDGTRCIVRDDMTSLPDGIQLHLGWKFHVSAVAPGMIVGYADNPNGATIGGKTIDPGTSVALYWRVYSLFGGRFCIISAPHIIGTVVRQPLPMYWRANWPGRSARLEHLKQYLAGTLASYMVVNYDSCPPGTLTITPVGSGVYNVTGLDGNGLPSVATIDKNGNVTIVTIVPAGVEYNVIIDTYDPANPGNLSGPNMHMELWTPDGTAIALHDTLDGNGNPRPGEGAVGIGYAYIDTTTTGIPDPVHPTPPVGSLTSGDYYVLIRQAVDKLTTPTLLPWSYAIRVLATKNTTPPTPTPTSAWQDYTGWGAADSDMQIVPQVASDQPLDGAPWLTPNGHPTAILPDGTIITSSEYPQIIYSGTTSDRMERTIVSNATTGVAGVNWVHIHLP